MVKQTDLSKIIKEIEKTRAALTVLYEKALEENKELTKHIIKLEQRCKALEFRLKRVENTLQGDMEHPGIVTQLWHIKNNLDKNTEEVPINNERKTLMSIPPNKPLNTISVHPVWIRVFMPTLISIVLVLTAILSIILFK